MSNKTKEEKKQLAEEKKAAREKKKLEKEKKEAEKAKKKAKKEKKKAKREKKKAKKEKKKAKKAQKEAAEVAEELAEVKKAKKKTPKWLVILVSVLLALVLAAAVLFFGVYRGINMWAYAELGEGTPDASVFVKGEGSAKYVGNNDISLTEEGNYILTVDKDGAVRKVLLFVRDTKAPTADNSDVTITIDDKLTPEETLTNLYDASDYSIEWKTKPEFGTAGTYKTEISVKDTHGNKDVIKVNVIILGAVDRLVYEAGDVRPTIDDFMVVERDNAEIVTDMKNIKWNVPGENKVEISFDGKTYSSVLEIVDTVAPVPDKIVAATLKDTAPDAADFTLGFEDATAVTSVYVTEPDVSKIGTASCTLKATDLGKNETEFEASVIVADKIVELEAENKTVTEAEIKAILPVEYKDYVIDPEASDLDFELTELGAHAVSLAKGEDKALVAIMVKDTTAPTAEGIECPCSTGYFCDPIKFVTNIVDMSSVKAEFVEEPDWSVEGTQDVEIVLTDRSGNTTTVAAKAVITPDKTAPVILAARDRYCYVGDAVSYFKEVMAEDNADPNPTIEVDKSKVDAKTAGTYDVTYTATDHEGNTSSVTVKFTFIEKSVTEEQLQTAVDKVTAEIFTDDMNSAEKALAVFNYCYDNITYWGTSDKTDLYGEAYRGLTEGVGDCYTFYATSYILLQEIDDIQVLSVERMNGKTQHFWCLVNLGSGWYHFDTCNVGPQHYKCFMKMNSDLAPLSPQYWVFNEALYPQVATTPFVMP